LFLHLWFCWLDRLTMCVCLLTLLTCVISLCVGTATVSAQPSFPALLDVSRDQHVTSVPSSSVCGLSTVSSFCRSSTSVTSVSRCLPATCSSQCPRRTATPARCICCSYSFAPPFKPLSKCSPVIKLGGSFSSPSILYTVYYRNCNFFQLHRLLQNCELFVTWFWLNSAESWECVTCLREVGMAWRLKS